MGLRQISTRLYILDPCCAGLELPLSLLRARLLVIVWFADTNSANTMFRTVPPTIQEYLPLNENFAAAPSEMEGLDAADFDARYRWGNDKCELRIDFDFVTVHVPHLAR